MECRQFNVGYPGHFGIEPPLSISITVADLRFEPLKTKNSESPEKPSVIKAVSDNSEFCSAIFCGAASDAQEYSRQVTVVSVVQCSVFRHDQSFHQAGKIIPPDTLKFVPILLENKIGLPILYEDVE